MLQEIVAASGNITNCMLIADQNRCYQKIISGCIARMLPEVVAASGNISLVSKYGFWQQKCVAAMLPQYSSNIPANNSLWYGI